MKKGISITNSPGLGDVIQFTSLPENYFRATGKRLVDVSKSWAFDFNPYVTREVEADQVTELWGNWTTFKRPNSYLSPDVVAPAVFLSNAEHHATLLRVPVVLNRPRLYRFEDYPFAEREMILLHVDGRSHGDMPEHIVDHVLKKYKDLPLFQIGGLNAPDLGIPKIETPTVWDLARTISESRMLIGMDSGPSWVAACYPDVIVKKIRTRPDAPEIFNDWVPLEMSNIHSHWDDRAFQIFNVSEDDVGMTQSYRKI